MGSIICESLLSLLFCSDSTGVSGVWIPGSVVELFESLSGSAAQTALQSITAKKNTVRMNAPRFSCFTFSTSFFVANENNCFNKSYFQMKMIIVNILPIDQSFCLFNHHVLTFLISEMLFSVRSN
jgi:hypothetical protein